MSSNVIGKRLGDRIRQLRSSRGLSQERLAELADLSRDAVSRIERADREPRLETLDALAQALGIELPDILKFDRGPPRPFNANELRVLRIMRHLCSVDGWMADRVVEVVATLCTPAAREPPVAAEAGTPQFSVRESHEAPDLMLESSPYALVSRLAHARLPPDGEEEPPSVPHRKRRGS